MNFRTLRHLRQDLVAWLPHLPRVDLIVGIPRSGMIPAAILAEFLQCRLTSLDLFAGLFLDLRRRSQGAEDAIREGPGPR